MSMESFEGGPIAMDEQVKLAKALAKAHDARNEAINQFPDFDAYNVFLNAHPDNRKRDNELNAQSNEAAAEFEANVPDKKALVDHLREIGEEKLAGRVARMYQAG